MGISLNFLPNPFDLILISNSTSSMKSLISAIIIRRLVSLWLLIKKCLHNRLNNEYITSDYFSLAFIESQIQDDDLASSLKGSSCYGPKLSFSFFFPFSSFLFFSFLFLLFFLFSSFSYFLNFSLLYKIHPLNVQNPIL